MNSGVSERLILLRKAKGLTKKALAEEIGLPYSTYFHYEDGSMELKASVLIKLVKFYKVSADWIIGEDGKKNPPPENRREILKGLCEELSDDELKEMYSYVTFLKWKMENKL